ncbi:CorA family divalent cation transporter [Thalassotalea euphylliae]|uniref:CorA family divalent cation transporter n=1 Tax=Thalassotalea euphylliae TaxID=1655234 RepID=UPI00362FDB7E
MALREYIYEAWHINGKQSKAISDLDELNLPNTWLHCNRTDDNFHQWLVQENIDESIIESLLASDTRPRFQRLEGDAFLLIVRGVNLNKGKQPDDMLTVRMLYTGDRLITCNSQTSRAIEATSASLARGKGPCDLPQLVIELLTQLHLRIDSFLDPIEEFIDAQDKDKFDPADALELNDMLRKLLKLNRFLKPQAHALNAVVRANMPIFESLSLALANQQDVLSRIVESIDFYIAQVDVINAKIAQQNAELMNRNTYILSIIAGIFLPLGFLTGLFGINIGGMPGVENEQSFYLFCGILLVIGVLEYLVFRRLKFL